MKNTIKSVVKWFSKFNKTIIFTIIGLLIAGTIYYVVKPDKPKEVSYMEFTKMVKTDKVEEVKITLTSPTFTFTDTKDKRYETDNPKDEKFKKFLLEENVKVVEVKNKKAIMFDMLMNVLKIFAFLFAFKIIMDSMNNKNVANMDDPDSSVPKVKFDNIAGNNEAKEEMEFLVEFLKNPKKYSDKGAKLPKGVAFYGPPGTGKTLMAKAIAGEAGVPFFSISGSDFVEMYVGLGAKRVRSLFKEARKKAPCIVFIDEIDAVGTKRGQDDNTEKDQTINALLNELDGFSGSEGIIVITATNRIEDLDNALIRPGRFDKHIAISLPDQNDREEILKVHAKNKQIAEDVNLNKLAKLTQGFAGAGLESLINEATIISVTRNHEEVTKEDIDDAFYKVVMKGHKKKNQKDRNLTDLEITAWHEAGHALVAKLLAKNDVPLVTIASSTNGAGGVTFITPKKMDFHSKIHLMNEVKTLYAGRIGEFLLLKDENKITTGASSDIEQATEIIHDMVTKYGMTNKFGMLNPLQVSDFDAHNDVLSEATFIAKTLYNETLVFMKENKTLLEAIALSLLDKESISEEELDLLIKQHQEDSMS